MGIDLVRLALLQHAAALTGRAFKVLTYMAAVALDKPNAKGQPARVYFAGEEPLAHVLYGMSAAVTPNQVREVRRVIQELADRGLITRTQEKARTGVRQGYVLNLTLGGESAHPDEGEAAHPHEGEAAPDRVGKLPTPRTHAGQSEDLSQDSSTNSATEPQTARRHDTTDDLIAGPAAVRRALAEANEARAAHSEATS